MFAIIGFTEQGQGSNPIETPMLKSQMSVGKCGGRLWQWVVIRNWEERAGYLLCDPHNYMARKHIANCGAGDSAATRMRWRGSQCTGQGLHPVCLTLNVCSDCVSCLQPLNPCRQPRPSLAKPPFQAQLKALYDHWN